MQKYMYYFDEPRINPTKVYTRLIKRDQMLLDCSDVTVATLSQMICYAASWTCTASVVRSEIGWACRNCDWADVPPALRVPVATPASSDAVERRETRNARFRIPPNEEGGQALISFAADPSRSASKPTSRNMKRTTTCGRS